VSFDEIGVAGLGVTDLVMEQMSPAMQ